MLNILNPKFQYIPASSHSNVDAFRQRQLERMKKAQQQAPRKVEQKPRKAA